MVERVPRERQARHLLNQAEGHGDEQDAGKAREGGEAWHRAAHEGRRAGLQQAGGDSYGVITRDGKDVPRFHGVDQNGAYRTEGYIIPDRERGAIKRLKRIMKCYPTLRPYIQGDPRGPALYILRPGDVPEGERDESFYTNGIAVTK